MRLPGLSSFTTARLALRPFVSSDATDAVGIFGDAEVMRFSLNGADSDAAATAARIERYVAAVKREGIGPFAVIEQASGALVGFCGLVSIADTEDVEIAYRFRRDRWGRGLASEAARATLERGFSELGLPRIVAYIDAT